MAEPVKFPHKRPYVLLHPYEHMVSKMMTLAVCVFNLVSVSVKASALNKGYQSLLVILLKAALERAMCPSVAARILELPHRDSELKFLFSLYLSLALALARSLAFALPCLLFLARSLVCSYSSL